MVSDFIAAPGGAGQIDDSVRFGLRYARGGGLSVTTLDWRSFSYGGGARDVAHFLAGGVSPELRRRYESQFLDRHLLGLRAHGVNDYWPRRPGAGLRARGAPALPHRLLAAMVVKQTARGDAMFIQMLGGASRHILDHDALSLLN